jgi:hypothetical protein
MVARSLVACLILTLCVATSLAAAQSFDCSSGSVVVPPGDYGAITIDTGATACASITIADVAANHITMYVSSGRGINVTGAVAITRLTCKPAATVCVEFASTVVAADSITLRGASYNSTIVSSAVAEATLLVFRNSVAGVRSVEVADVDMRLHAASLGDFTYAFMTRFASSVNAVGAGAWTWRNTTFIATLTGPTDVYLETVVFGGEFSGSSATTLAWDGVLQRVSATSTGGVVGCFVTRFVSSVTGVSALEWRNTALGATLTANVSISTATAWIGGALTGTNATTLTWDGISQRVNATSTGGHVQCYMGFLASITGVSALEWRNTTLVATLTASSSLETATTWFNGALSGTNATSLTWEGVSQRVNASATGGAVDC